MLGDSRNSGCELGRFVALLQPSGVTEADQASWGGRLWLRGEEGAVLGLHRHPLVLRMVSRKGKGLLVMLELTTLELK